MNALASIAALDTLGSLLRCAFFGLANAALILLLALLIRVWILDRRDRERDRYYVERHADEIDDLP